MTEIQFKQILITLMPDIKSWLTDETLKQAAIYLAVMGWCFQMPETPLTLEIKPYIKNLYEFGDFKFDPEPPSNGQYL